METISDIPFRSRYGTGLVECMDYTECLWYCDMTDNKEINPFCKTHEHIQLSIVNLQNT